MNCIIISIVGNYPKYKNTKTLFIKVVKELTKNNNWYWVRAVWYRKDTILKSLTSKDVDVILENLLLVPQIDYDAEEVLAIITETHPTKIIDFFEKRISIKAKKKQQDCYDAVPYRFHEVSKSICKHAKSIIPLIFKWFKKRNGLYEWKLAT